MLLLLSFLTVTASAEVPYPHLNCTIPGAMEAWEIEELEQRLIDLRDTFGIDPVVYLVEDIGEGVNSAKYMSACFAEGVAEFEYRQNGIAFIYNKGGSKWAITLEGFADIIFTNDDLIDLWDAFAADGTYYEGVSWYIDTLEDMFYRYDEVIADAFMNYSEGDISVDEQLDPEDYEDFTGNPSDTTDEPTADETATDEAPANYVYYHDDITSLSNSQRLELDNALASIRTNHGISAVVLFKQSTVSKNLTDYAANFYKDGMEAGLYNDTGIVLVLDETKEEWAIYLAGRTNVMFSSSDLQKYFDTFYNTGAYYDGVMAYAAALSTYFTNRGVLPIPDYALVPRLVDEADLLTDEQEADLLARLDEISKRLRCDVTLVTSYSLNGKTATAFADDYFDYNGYGYGDGRDGIIFLISPKERDWAFSTHGFGLTAFTDAGLDYMFAEMKDNLAADNYYAAFDTYVKLCNAFITAAHNGDPLDNHNLPKTQASIIAICVHLIIILAGCLFVAFIVVRIIKNSSAKKVTVKETAAEYTVKGSLDVTGSSDQFVSSHIFKSERSTDSGGGGGSSSHSSSSGSSHGGSSGKY